MKSFILSLLILIGGLGFTAVSADAQRREQRQRPQVRFHIEFGNRDHRRYNRGAYSRLEVKYERQYGLLYRNTYRVTYLPNGRVQYQLIYSERVY